MTEKVIQDNKDWPGRKLEKEILSSPRGTKMCPAFCPLADA